MISGILLLCLHSNQSSAWNLFLCNSFNQADNKEVEGTFLQSNEVLSNLAELQKTEWLFK